MDEDDDDIVIALRRGEDGWEYAAADEIEALRDEIKRRDEFTKIDMDLVADLSLEINKLRDENARLHQAMHDIYEVYAGSEGFHPETCPEAYLQERIKEMAYIARKHKRVGGGND